MSRIGHEANEAKRRRKKGSVGSEENPRDQRVNGDEQNDDADDAAFDDDPQLPGKAGATQAIKDRLQAESSGKTTAAIAIKAEQHEGDELQPARKYPRSGTKGRSSDRERMIEAITNQIKLNKAGANARKRDENHEVSSKAMQANSAKLRKTGDVAVQGREVELKHVHDSTNGEVDAFSSKLATSSNNTSTIERLMSFSRTDP